MRSSRNGRTSTTSTGPTAASMDRPPYERLRQETTTTPAA
jgi:hypothetical protein